RAGGQEPGRLTVAGGGGPGPVPRAEPDGPRGLRVFPWAECGWGWSCGPAHAESARERAGAWRGGLGPGPGADDPVGAPPVGMPGRYRVQDFGVMKGAARSARLERNTLGLRGPAYDELLQRLDERREDTEAEGHRVFTRIPFADPLVRVAIE